MARSQDPEEIARNALSRQVPNAEGVYVQHAISGFLGGDMYVLGFKRGDREDWWSVFVRDGVAKVYPEWNTVFSDVASYKPPRGFIGFLESQRGIIAVISLIIIISSLASILIYKDAGFVQYLQSPLSMVLGFWFGRGGARPEDPA